MTLWYLQLGLGLEFGLGLVNYESQKCTSLLPSLVRNIRRLAPMMQAMALLFVGINIYNNQRYLLYSPDKFHGD